MNSLTTMKGLVWKPTSSHIESTRASASQSYSIYNIPRLFWIPMNSIWQLITINLVFDFFNQTAKKRYQSDFRKLNRYNQTANRSWYKYKYSKVEYMRPFTLLQQSLYIQKWLLKSYYKQSKHKSQSRQNPSWQAIHNYV